MNILAIETSCDETAVSVLHAEGTFPHATYEVRGNELFSQIDLHQEYGGVFPAMAKREHVKTILPLATKALVDADVLAIREEIGDADTVRSTLHEICNHEAALADALADFYASYETLDIDAIAVTAGPGLEPTLWVGINFAIALSHLYNIPVVPVNHMKGHIFASVFTGTTLSSVTFPALSLLISGGHTELVVMRDWTTYERIGQTRDDAVGEAFDKVARLLGLPYPGGPEISKCAATARAADLPAFASLPRPMLDADNLDFSFSGLKTAVRYAVQEKELTADERNAIARDFEDAVCEVLLTKTTRAVDEHAIQSLILGGGVSANEYLREQFTKHFATEYPDLTTYLPDATLTGDNSVMIALAGHAHVDAALEPSAARAIRANGNQSITEKFSY